ncbi:MAG: RhuM family protein [Pseudomonadota bacterium]
MDRNKEIAIYRSKDGKIQLEVKLHEDTVWLTQKQIAELFGVKRPAITKHLANIFNSMELKENSVSSILEHTASDGKVYKTNYYNLDAVISVGYRVNSNKATQFRIWATNILKQYLISGYALNEKRLKHRDSKIKELHDAVKLLSHVMAQKELKSDEATGLLKVITDYTLALDLLDRYDHETVEIDKKHLCKTKTKPVTYEEALDAIKKFGRQFRGSELFGRPKDKSFHSSINTIYQTFGGRELYPTVEEKAAHLLYFVVKNHSFVDGNKRIGAFTFLYFLEKNGILYKADGSKILENNALVAITLMIAESKPQHKDTMVKMLVNLIDRKN